MNRVGHAFIKRRMRETNAVFGGEVTGHYYFRDNFYADNGFIPALLILELMSKKGKSCTICSSRCATSISSPARSTPSSRAWTPCQAKLEAIAQYADGKQYHARRPLGGISRLALQRPAVEHRAAAPAEPRSDDRAMMEEKRDEVVALIRS